MRSTVVAILARHLDRDASEIRASEHLYRDLGFTARGLAVVLLEVEDALAVQLDPGRLGSLRTVEDLLVSAEKATASRCVPVVVERDISSPHDGRLPAERHDVWSWPHAIVARTSG